jgi:hypothetical protein
MISDTLRARMEALLAIADRSCRTSLLLPLRTESRANARWHWGTSAEHSKKHRQAAHLVCKGRGALLRSWLKGGLVVRVVRVAPRALDGHDNLGAALKPIIDGVADALGVADNDERVHFVPDAIRGGVREHAVKLEFYPLHRRSP